MKRLSTLFVILALIVCSLPLAAQEGVMIRGFGSWAYGATDGNEYFWLSDESSWDFYDLALNITAVVTDDLRVSSQIYANSFLTNEALQIDFAFAEYTFSDALRVRVGKAKQMFGIYGDVKRVGIVRPFFSLPASLYEHDFFVAPGFIGAAALGNLRLGSGWNLDYDLYTGASTGTMVVGANSLRAAYYFGSKSYEGPAEELLMIFNVDLAVSNLYGLRLHLHTPVDGLDVMLSLSDYDTVGTNSEDGSPIYKSHTEGLAGSLVYQNNRWTLKAEAALMLLSGNLKSRYEIFWIEAAYKLTKKLRAVGRWENTEGIPTGVVTEQEAAFLELFPGQRTHDEWAIGLNYHFNRNFILKTALHTIEGLQWAAATGGLQAYLDDDINKQTNYVTVGVNYSF